MSGGGPFPFVEGPARRLALTASVGQPVGGFHSAGHGAPAATERRAEERRPVVVVPRETPVSRSHLEHLIGLIDSGAVVLPASPAFYAAGAHASAGQLVDFIAGKILDAVGVPHTLAASPVNSALQKVPPWKKSPTGSGTCFACAARASSRKSSARPVGR